MPSSVRQGTHCHSYAFMTRYCKFLYSMVNAYTRGVVEVLYARAVEVRSWCGRGTLEVRSWCGRGTLVVRSRYARAVEVRSWYGPSTVEVRSWCASGSVRFVNFSTGDTVRTVHVYTWTRAYGCPKYPGVGSWYIELQYTLDQAF